MTIVEFNDTLDEISRKYGVSTLDLMRWNNLKSSRIKAGQTIDIYTDKKEESVNIASNYDNTDRMTFKNPSKAAPINYVVKKGDTLGHIAERYNIKASDIRRWNGIRGSRIIVGQKLLIYPAN